MRDRTAVVIIQNKKVALIKRVRDGLEYYVFPGGGIESDEKREDAAKREAFEELGVEVKVKDCIAEVDFNGTQFYYLANIIGGEFGTGQGEEYTDESRNRGSYTPMWIDLDKLSFINVIPKEVASKVQRLFG